MACTPVEDSDMPVHQRSLSLQIPTHTNRIYRSCLWRVCIILRIKIELSASFEHIDKNIVMRNSGFDAD